MNARFLRDEAARFRVMAEETDREQSRLRLIAMAVHYEFSARSAHAMAGSDDPGTGNGSDDAGAEGALAQPEQAEVGRTLSGRTTASRPRGEASGQSRPVGRSRLRLPQSDA